MKVTAVEFAQLQGMKKPVAVAVLKFLEGKGAAKVVEKRRTTTGKGRSANVYEVQEQVNISFAG